MRLCPGARFHAHQTDDHAIAFNTRSMRSRIGWATHDFLHCPEIENIFAGTSAFSARSTCGRPIGHGVLLTHIMFCEMLVDAAFVRQ